MNLVSTAELRDIVEERLKFQSISHLVNHNEGAMKAIYDITHRPREWTTYWRADTILSAMGRPDLLHTLTLKEGK